MLYGHTKFTCIDLVNYDTNNTCAFIRLDTNMYLLYISSSSLFDPVNKSFTTAPSVNELPFPFYYTSVIFKSMSRQVDWLSSNKVIISLRRINDSNSQSDVRCTHLR